MRDNLQTSSWLWYYTLAKRYKPKYPQNISKFCQHTLQSQEFLWILRIVVTRLRITSKGTSKFIIKLMSCWKTYLYKLCRSWHTETKKIKCHPRLKKKKKKIDKTFKNIRHAWIKVVQVYTWYKSTVYKQYALFYIMALYEKKTKRYVYWCKRVGTKCDTSVVSVIWEENTR